MLKEQKYLIKCSQHINKQNIMNADMWGGESPPD